MRNAAELRDHLGVTLDRIEVGHALVLDYSFS
jgi:hypothetical protein